MNTRCFGDIVRYGMTSQGHPEEVAVGPDIMCGTCIIFNANFGSVIYIYIFIFQ